MKIKDAYPMQWFKIYGELATLLSRFYQKNKNKSAENLYILCKEDDAFFLENNWFQKFAPQWQVFSLDPMHLFASISGNRNKMETRVRRLNILFRLLGSNANKQPLTQINMTGCPQPMPIHLVAARDEQHQIEIWQTFNGIFERGIQGLDDNTFDKVKSWYGFGIGSLTLLLFWTRSNSFLPLDKNTMRLLKQHGKASKMPNTVKAYKELLTADNTDVYRTISLLAYAPQSETGLSPEKIAGYQRYFSISAEQAQKAFSTVTERCRILAIRPLYGCNEQYLKSLKPGTLYTFYRNFKENDKTIDFNSNCDLGLYNLDGVNMNLSAIVGKNGTGKSTLLELLVIAFNNLSAAKFDKQPNQKNIESVKDIHLEFYFETDTIYKVMINRKITRIVKYRLETEYVYAPCRELDAPKFDFESFFYTILINYSLHGLNSEHTTGEWLKQLFHKNDAYQLPVVIEPYRQKGVIDINNQELLLKQRLLSNLFDLEDTEVNQAGDRETSLRELKEGVKTTEVHLSFRMDDAEFDLKTHPSQGHHYVILKSVYDVFDVDENKIKQSDISLVIERYIVHKILNIAVTYEHYSQYAKLRHNGVAERQELMNEMAQKLYKDKSHITYKLRQAINFFKFGLYPAQLQQTLNIEKISNDIAKVRFKDSEQRIEFLLPPAPFDVDIGLAEMGNITFASLSSGEKQKIYTINSVLYHIRNLDSVYDSGEIGLNKYGFINLFMDEIELCFHPELQRTFVRDLLSALGRRPLQHIQGINMCFVTHSPFLLSDIPHQGILFLDNENKPSLKTVPSTNCGPTFAANIHDLLADGFFMESSIGAYAEQCIKAIVQIYQAVRDNSIDPDIESKYRENRYKYHFILDAIADSQLHTILSNHIKFIETRLKLVSDVDFEIIQLEKRLNQLKGKNL